MIVTEGGKFGGYGFYLLKGKPVFTYNLFNIERFRCEGPAALAPGKHTLGLISNTMARAWGRAERVC